MLELFLPRAFGVPISLANRNKLRLQMGFDSETAARERTEKENVGIKAVSIFLQRMERIRMILELGNLFV